MGEECAAAEEVPKVVAAAAASAAEAAAGSGSGGMSPWMMPVVASLVTAVVCGAFVALYYFCVARPRLQRLADRYVRKEAPEGPGKHDVVTDTRSFSLKTKSPVGATSCKVLYATVKGTSKQLADDVVKALTEDGVKCSKTRLSEEGRAALLESEPLVIVLPTYEDGKPPASCSNFWVWLQARYAEKGPKFETRPRYTILGLGHSDYSASGTYNKAAKDMHKMLKALGAKPFGPGVVLGDEAKNTIDAAFGEWLVGVRAGLQNVDDMKNVGVYEVGTEEDETRSQDDACGSDDEGELPDVEDIVEPSANDAKDAEMINPRMSKALTKQGYHLIGTHSGVKLCRWTKAQLRGRGGCYKHTFYGITSYECMEMTPSLACANKCVFCWRHHTNPVSKEWKWKMDDPEFLVDKAVEGQRQMIKPLKGVPGVQPDRFEKAMNPSHCALSLVGEPIIYPEINKLVDCLHERKISSFLVTNAQFPEKIEELKPVTQLYISVDAATKESMKAIDRPIFDDFWERFLAGVDIMKKKGQRTVFRLTLVKGWNATEVQNYAELILRGQPDFVEVKGVTWCGESTASNLSMSNVPFHKEVLSFCSELADACGAQYALASEHEHSCCVLIAHTRFRREDGWYTWIDFPRFHVLADSGKAFTTEDYLLRTPDWGQYGSNARGFDPEETRYVKVRNHPGRE